MVISNSKIKTAALSLFLSLSSNAVKAQILRAELQVIYSDNMPKRRTILNSKADAEKLLFLKHNKLIKSLGKSLGVTFLAYAVFISLTNPLKAAQEKSLQDNELIDITCKEKTEKQLTYLENIDWLRPLTPVDRERISKYYSEDKSLLYFLEFSTRAAGQGRGLNAMIAKLCLKLEKNVRESLYSLTSVQERALSFIESQETFQEKREVIAFLSNADHNLKAKRSSIIAEMSEDYYYCLRDRVHKCIAYVNQLENSDYDNGICKWSYQETLGREVLDIFEQQKSYPCYETCSMLQNIKAAQDALCLLQIKWIDNDELQRMIKKADEDALKSLLEYDDIEEDTS